MILFNIFNVGGGKKKKKTKPSGAFGRKRRNIPVDWVSRLASSPRSSDIVQEAT